MMIKAVLFDLDGTLVNSLGDLAASVNFVLERNGFPVHAEDEFRYFAGDGIPKMIERALPENCRTEEIKHRCTEQFLERYSKHFADLTRPYPGIPELLEGLRRRGIETAVVSNKAQEMAECVVKRAFGDRMSLIIGKREGVAAKPDPAALLLAAKLLGKEPRECAFLGDSGMDMAAAVRAGMKAVGVLWGFRTAKELEENGAEALIKTPGELTDII